MIDSMKKNFKWIVAAIIAFVVSLLTPSPLFNKQGMYIKDNPVEERLEDFIEEKTGIDVDLSPETKEKSPDKKEL